MTKLFSLELATWFRNKRFVVLVFVFLAIAISSTVMAYNINNLLEAAGENGAQITMPNPSAAALVQSYMKTASQIGLFIAAYLVSDASILKRQGSQRIYYVTTALNRSRIYIPKLLIGILLSASAMFMGACCALYITWCYFENMPLAASIQALGFQIIGFLLFTFLAGTIGILTCSAFVAALTVEGMVILGSYLDGFPLIHKWSFTTLLAPNEIVSNGFEWATWWRPILSSIALFLVCAFTFSIYFLKAKVYTYRGSEER